MAYFLRQEKKKKGLYLQMYDSYWDKEMKQSRTKNVMAFGYVEDLISDEIPDPVAYYKEFVRRKNDVLLLSQRKPVPVLLLPLLNTTSGSFSSILSWKN